MKSYSAVIVLALGTYVSATAPPAAQMTPGPERELRVRQGSNAESVLGWVSTSGASKVSDFRSCDFPATLSLSGSYAQCCTASSACNFYTACSGNVLLGASTSVSCEVGRCNTGVIVASVGASSGGVSNLACWGTSLGTGAFSLVKSVDSSLIAAATPTGPSSASKSSTSSGSSTTTTGSTKTTSGGFSSSSSGGPTSSSSVAPNVAAAREIGSGIVGLIVGIAALV